MRNKNRRSGNVSPPVMTRMCLGWRERRRAAEWEEECETIVKRVGTPFGNENNREKE